MDVDVVACFGKCLLDRQLINKLQAICERHAPSWSSKLRLWPPASGVKHSHGASAIYDFLEADVTTPSPFYGELVATFGSSASVPKICSTSELRGADNSITIVVNIDERIFCKIANSWTWGNRISFQLRRKRIEGASASSFAKRLLKDVCGTLDPWYAHAESIAEFDAKNISHEGGGVKAVGVDISKSLPGLYWLNYFGGPSVDAIGRERFEACAAFEKERLPSGFLVALSDDPCKWAGDEYALVERKVLDSLGEHWFFHRENAGLPTKSPFFLASSAESESHSRGQAS